MQDTADLVVDRDGHRAGDRVADRDELDLELVANLVDPARLDLDQAGQVGDLCFFELGAYEGERQRRAVDCDWGNVFELREDVRDGADVVLVAVGNQEAAQPAAVILKIADVRDNQVDSAHLLFGELAAAIDHNHVAAILDDHHALADFAAAPQRYCLQSCLGHVCVLISLESGEKPSSVITKRQNIPKHTAQPAMTGLNFPAERAYSWEQPARHQPR